MCMRQLSNKLIHNLKWKPPITINFVSIQLKITNMQKAEIQSQKNYVLFCRFIFQLS